MPKQTISMPVTTMAVADTTPRAPVLSRQTIRRAGYYEILLELKRRYPNTSRAELRRAARICQQDAWSQRDREAIKKLTAHVTP